MKEVEVENLKKIKQTFLWLDPEKVMPQHSVVCLNKCVQRLRKQIEIYLAIAQI